MMKLRIRNLLIEKDIIPNIIETYPNNALLAPTEESFYGCLYGNNCNILCYHISRLTHEEIINIKKFGLVFGSKDLLYNKVKNLPSCCDWFKAELIEHIKKLRETQADNAICASYGYLDLEKDPGCDNIFHINWGGETIYNYYDKGNRFRDERLQKIHETLQQISYPCIIILRVDIPTFCNSELHSLFARLKKTKDSKKIFGSLYIENTVPEVVDIIDLNIYDGIDFN